MLGFLAPIAGEALKQGVSQSPTAGPASSRSDNWFDTRSDFTVNTGGSSPLLMAAAIAALVLVALFALRKG